MATKKPVRSKKTGRRGERKRGLTSAIGPKATTALVIVVLAGGLVIGERMHTAKDKQDDVVGTVGTDTVLAPDGPAARTVAPKKTSETMPTDGETAVQPKTPFVTVAGCLERNNDGFRLKETTGADAPKARSWKSGFMKKGSASIDLADPAHSVALADYVGRRVSVTGTLTGRDMKVKSVRRMAPTCE